MANNKLRGINEEFANAFRKSSLHSFYTKHKDELILGVRRNHINLYYSCGSVALIRYKRQRTDPDKEKKFYCTTSYYSNNEEVLSEEIVNHYDETKKHIQKSRVIERKVQVELFLQNNRNPNSKWYCIDIEYANSNYKGHPDVIAISKTKPYRLALIELKYGRGAYNGKSGVVEHVKDLFSFRNKSYFDPFKQEMVNIINSQRLLGVNIPQELHSIDAKNISDEPEFYFITLNNNIDKTGGSTPKQSMAAYLFNKDNNKFKEWECKRHAGKCVEDILGDITRKSNGFYATFLFSTAIYPEIGITDIIDGEYEERIVPE